MRHGWLLLIAAATGAAIMVLELMAVRLMAPWFGQSQIVWTNVIGIVLAALAAGQWLGGRWTERAHGAPIITLMLVAGSLSMVMPELVGLLAPLTLPADLQLSEAWPFVTYGSMLVTIVTMGVPMAALGAVTPWLIRLSRESSRTPGKVSGALLGAGTVGSLIGTFGATHVLLPEVGSTWAIRIAAMFLLAVAVSLMISMRRCLGPAPTACLLVPLAVFLIPQPGPDAGVLAAVETIYQDARVEVDEDGTRLLRINEGLDSFHSAYRVGELWTDRYFDAFLAPALVSPNDAAGVQRVLILGLGAGTMARQITEVSPQTSVHGVELDSELIRLGYDWFGLPASVHVLSGVDARVALKLGDQPFSAIFIDAYSQQIYVPAHLCTVEFFQEVKARLLTGGIAALNIGGRSWEDPVVRAVAGTFVGVFPGSVMARIPGTRNMMLLGVRDGTFSHETLLRTLAEYELVVPGLHSRLAWMTDPARFGMVRRIEAAHILRDAGGSVEALAHAAWRTSW